MLKIENVLPARVGSMILKMPFLNQDPASTNILHFARRVPSEMKIMKISPMVVLGRPGGMRGGAGRRYEEGLRSANLRLANSDLCFGFDTPALLYETGGGFKRYTHSAGPGFFMQWCDDAMV